MTDLDKLEALARLEEMAAWCERGDEGAEGSVLLSASVADEHAKDLRDLIASARRDAEEIERLIGYAVHDDACTTNRFPGQGVCSCGLSSLLQRIRHEREAQTAHTGEGTDA